MTATVRVLRGVLTVLKWIDDGLLKGLDDQDEVEEVGYALVLATEIIGKSRL